MEHFLFEHWITTFCIYCTIGWVQESIIESAYHRKLINRGFLKGPYIPIYGIGGILLALIGMPFKENGYVVFFVSMAACTVLEYFTGMLMEKVFGKQFWDYSMFKLAYKNRISLVSSLFWGVLGLFVTYILSDITVAVVTNIPHFILILYPLITLTFMTIDFFITVRKELGVSEKRFDFGNITSRFDFHKLNVLSRFHSSDEDDDSDEQE